MILYIVLVGLLTYFIMANIDAPPIIRMIQTLGVAGQPQEEAGNSSGGSKQQPGNPTPVDIAVVRIMLCRSKQLPPDVVDTIFDYAEYWAHSSNHVDFVAEHGSPLRINGSSSVEDKFILRSFPVGLTGPTVKQDLSEELAYDLNEAKPQPLVKEHDPSFFTRLAHNYPSPNLIRPVRKVVFSFKSKDQGWGGDVQGRGTYRCSWTWFEAGLERFDAEQECDAQCTYDVRFKSSSSKPAPLPVCALRPLQPEIEPLPASPTPHPPREEEEFDSDSENGVDPFSGPEPEPERHPEERYKYVHPLHDHPKWLVQKNKAATRSWQEYEITWSCWDDVQADSDAGQALEDGGRGRETGDGAFVRDLKMGDVVTLWGKVRFGGWINHVERAQIDVYWAV